MHTLICARCGKEFQHKNKLALTCSEKCRRARKRDQDVLCKSGRSNIGKVVKCAYCGKEYEVTGTTQKYCSVKCRKANDRKLCKAREKSVPATCIICGHGFLTSKNSTAKTCSPACLTRYKSILTTERERKKKADALNNCEAAMPCPWATHKIDTLPHGVASWDCPEMDPMSGGFPMITFSVPVAREVAA